MNGHEKITSKMANTKVDICLKTKKTQKNQKPEQKAIIRNVRLEIYQIISFICYFMHKKQIYPSSLIRLIS